MLMKVTRNQLLNFFQTLKHPATDTANTKRGLDARRVDDGVSD
jgi:hypothetical protein